MTPTDVIRWGWTILTGFGVLFAFYNLWEVRTDDRAVAQLRPKGMDVMRLLTRGEVWNHLLIFLALAADFVAGVFALSGQGLAALVALIGSAAALIVLSFSQSQRRRRLFRSIRLQRPKPSA